MPTCHKCGYEPQPLKENASIYFLPGSDEDNGKRWIVWPMAEKLLHFCSEKCWKEFTTVKNPQAMYKAW